MFFWRYLLCITGQVGECHPATARSPSQAPSVGGSCFHVSGCSATATHRSHTLISKAHINKESKADGFLYSYHVITFSFFFLFFFFLTLGILFKVQKLTLKREASAECHNSPHPCLKGIFVNIPSRWLRTLRCRGCCMCDQLWAHAAPWLPGTSLSCSHNNQALIDGKSLHFPTVLRVPAAQLRVLTLHDEREKSAG